MAYYLAQTQLTDASYSTSVSGPSQVYHFSHVSAADCGWHLDAANQDASNGYIL